MTPKEMALIHAAAFTQTRPWSENEFKTLLSSAAVSALTECRGFAIIRTIAGESELLTLAVEPSAQRQGIAQKIMSEWLNTLQADEAFLEVAADNDAAIALYTRYGFAHAARRPAYYARKNGTPVDAIVMRIALP